MATLRLLRHGLEPVMIAAALTALYSAGFVSREALWLGIPMLVAGMVYQQPEVQLRLSGGDLGERLALRLWIHLALVSAFLYSLGWGAIGAIAHLNILSIHLKMSGSRAWRPAVVASLGTLAIGEVLTVAGVFHSYLPQPEGHAISVMVAVGAAITARVMGLDHRQLEESEERFRILVQDGNEIITVSRADGVTTYISPSVERNLGYTPEEMLGRRYLRLLHPDCAAEVAELRAALLADRSGSDHRCEIRVRHADGSWRWQETVLRNMLDHPAVRGVVGHHRDVTQRRAAQDQVVYAATHDALTGLVNPATFRLGLERALARPDRDYPVGLLFVDLDGFKQVNDLFGHATGDGLLGLVGAMIRDTTRGGDVVGRLGGDEFGVVLAPVDGPADAVAVARRIIEAVDRDLVVDGKVVRVGCSIGIALAGPETTDAAALTRSADAAMYVTKRRGRNGFEVAPDPGANSSGATTSGAALSGAAGSDATSSGAAGSGWAAEAGID